MVINESVSKEYAAAAAALLQSAVPGITPAKLIEALRLYNGVRCVTGAPVSERPLTPNEAAHILKVSPWTIRRYIASGRLKSARVNRFFRIDPASVRDLLDIKKEI